MLSESLRAVISQTLCKTKGRHRRVAAHVIMIGTRPPPHPDRRAQVRRCTPQS